VRWPGRRKKLESEKGVGLILVDNRRGGGKQQISGGKGSGRKQRLLVDLKRTKIPGRQIPSTPGDIHLKQRKKS